MSVNKHIFIWLTLLALLVSNLLHGQITNTPLTLYQQFNGNFGYTVIGNTHNSFDNKQSPPPPCQMLTSSSATLNLNPNQTIEGAYLIWSGIGDGVGTSVTFNGNLIIPDYTNFASVANSITPYFSAVRDITSYVQNFGNGIYQISNFDLNSIINQYCATGIYYSGWNIVVVYSENFLPNVQLNIYDGLQSPILNAITINNLNVTNTTNANMACLSWNGSPNIFINESITINGNLLSNARKIR